MFSYTSMTKCGAHSQKFLVANTRSKSALTVTALPSIGNCAPTPYAEDKRRAVRRIARGRSSTSARTKCTLEIQAIFYYIYIRNKKKRKIFCVHIVSSA